MKALSSHLEAASVQPGIRRHSVDMYAIRGPQQQVPLPSHSGIHPQFRREWTTNF